MIFRFHSENLGGLQFPCCDREGAGIGYIDPISRILMDDGGLPLTDSIEWIQSGIGRASSSLLDGVVREWGREEWDTEIGQQTTKVYYIQDDSIFDFINTVSFVALLCQWKIFLLGCAENSGILEVKVEI